MSLIVRFFQLGDQVRVVLHQVAEVCDGRFLVDRIWKIEPRQLPFGVRADSEIRFVHIIKRFFNEYFRLLSHSNDIAKLPERRH